MLYTKFVTGLVLATLILSSSPVSAQTDTSDAALTTPGTELVLNLPSQASNSPVISLGQAVDPATGLVVDGYAIIHPRQEQAKPEGVGGGNGGSAKNTCYTLLGKGAKWKAVEPWIVNAQNTQGLDETWVKDNLSASIDKWEDASEVDILGAGTLTTDPLAADTVTPDGNNEVLFGSIDEANVIGVTIVWGVFSGPIQNRVLLEWDQVYDQIDFAWSATGEAEKMDFENVSTHELGHTVGLSHPADTCVDETMYRYADFGETIRRSLNAGDIAGVAELY